DCRNLLRPRIEFIARAGLSDLERNRRAIAKVERSLTADPLLEMALRACVRSDLSLMSSFVEDEVGSNGGVAMGSHDVVDSDGVAVSGAGVARGLAGEDEATIEGVVEDVIGSRSDVGSRLAIWRWTMFCKASTQWMG
ncbi:hypothetical protein Dimus_029482, partial [Dionaea muscipula]